MDANNVNRAPPIAFYSTDLSGYDEAAFLGQLREGDDVAYEILVRQHGGRMLMTARRFFSDEQDAADAVQDAFISAFKAIKAFKGDSKLGTWLHRIVVNCCLMQRRSRDRHPALAIELRCLNLTRLFTTRSRCIRFEIHLFAR